VNEALIEKVADAIRQSAVMKMEEGEDVALYVANIWRTYARAALATIEAEQQAEVAAYRAALGRIATEENVVYLGCADVPFCQSGEHHEDCPVRIARAALEPLERTLGSTISNEIPQSGGLSQ
jgi:hypothetical protein